MKCWCCGKAEMVVATPLGNGWFVCPLCGATWTKLLKAEGQKLVKMEMNYASKMEEYSPSESVTSRARKAREAKA